MHRWTALAIILILASGCSSYTVAKYGISPGNVTTLRAVSGQKVNVGAFTAAKPGQTEMMCRAVGPIKTPDGQPFEEYVRKALIDELRVAELFADTAPITLTGSLNKIDFSSNIPTGKWNLDVTVRSSNGNAVTVVEAYEYETSFIGEKGCALTAQAFGPAVQSLIGKLVRTPEFAGLLK
jgi:hypothetical protein